MNKIENLNKILENIKKIPQEYYRRSILKHINEANEIFDILVNNKIKNVIEIGTFNGLSAAVFASIIEGNVYTINVDEKEINNSKKLWDDLKITNIKQYKGSSLNVLPKLVDEIDEVNFVFVDGNHDIPYASKEFEIIKNSKIKDGNCLVYFHDHWSKGVKQAVEDHNLIKGKHNYHYIFGIINMNK